MKKLKINRVELIGNLARDAKVTGNGTFLTLAVFNGKDRPANFIDVALFKKNIDSTLLKKGTAIAIEGKLTIYKDKNNFDKLSVIGINYELIPRDYFKKQKDSEDKEWDDLMHLFDLSDEELLEQAKEEHAK